MRRMIATLLMLCIMLCLSPVVLAEGPQHTYNTDANSGIRHELCTTLEGTSALNYYTGEYTYDNLASLDSDALLQALRNLMTTTHTTETTYNQCRDLAVKTDCENADGTSISLLYTGYSTDWDHWCNNFGGGWNREHVWPKSLGGFGNTGPGADLHHVRPSDQGVNSARDNQKYGNAGGGKEVFGAAYTGKAPGGSQSAGYFEPLDNVKGDVARIILYVYVRYGGQYSSCSNLTNVFESMDVLLQWCALDPVDTWEMGRNEVVAAIQGNRNVFIDYPELAWLVCGREVPEGLVTPSSGHEEEPECTHEGQVLVQNGKLPTCGEDGFTGDNYCAMCGVLVGPGSQIPATGEHSFGDWTVVKAATAVEEGLRQRVCTVCNRTESQPVPVDATWIWITLSAAAAVACAVVIIIVLKDKK